MSLLPRIGCAALTFAVSLCAAAPAVQAGSSFRVTEIKPVKDGAKVELTFANEWGSAEKNKENAEVTCYIYSTYATEKDLSDKQWTQQPPYVKPGAKVVGQFTWLGTGSGSITLDYAKLGLEAGKTVFLQACWNTSNHVWGSCGGRETGAWVLPAARNSRLQARRQLAPWLRVPRIARRAALPPTLRCFATRPPR